MTVKTLMFFFRSGFRVLVLVWLVESSGHII